MPMQFANVIAWDRLQTGERALDPDSGEYRYRLLAEGDSWFTLGGLPTSNLLFSLAFPASTLIVNCAMPGDTIRHVAEIAANRELQAALSSRFGFSWDAILLSGGGNDLIDRVRDILLPATRRARKPARSPARLLRGVGHPRPPRRGHGRLPAHRRLARRPGQPMPWGAAHHPHVRLDHAAQCTRALRVRPREGSVAVSGADRRQGPATRLAGGRGLSAPTPRRRDPRARRTRSRRPARVLRRRDARHAHARGTGRDRCVTRLDERVMNEIHPTAEGYAKLAAVIGTVVRQRLGVR